MTIQINLTHFLLFLIVLIFLIFTIYAIILMKKMLTIFNEIQKILPKVNELVSDSKELIKRGNKILSESEEIIEDLKITTNKVKTIVYEGLNIAEDFLSLLRPISYLKQAFDKGFSIITNLFLKKED